jgi:hypothetical protein
MVVAKATALHPEEPPTAQRTVDLNLLPAQGKLKHKAMPDTPGNHPSPCR